MTVDTRIRLMLVSAVIIAVGLVAYAAMFAVSGRPTAATQPPAESSSKCGSFSFREDEEFITLDNCGTISKIDKYGTRMYQRTDGSMDIFYPVRPSERRAKKRPNTDLGDATPRYTSDWCLQDSKGVLLSCSTDRARRMYDEAHQPQIEIK